MGLYGLAKRAGAARGAYMADMENYNRGRLAAMDQIARDNAAQRAEMMRQQMGFAANADARNAAAEQRAMEEFTQNQKWNAQTRTWAEEDRKRRLAQEVEDRKRAEEMHNARIDHINAQTDQIDAKTDYLNMAGAQPGYLPQMTRSPSARMPRAAGNGNNPVTVKPAVSDTIVKANAEAVTPDRMKYAFGRKFYDTDENIQKRTGMSRDELMKTLADQYRAHILSARENSMSEDEFIRKAAGQFGFWDKHDLGRLINYMGRKDRYGHWYTGGTRTAEEEYARRNPAFYKQQKKLISEIDNGVKTFTHDNDFELANIIKTSKEAVRIFDEYHNEKGKSAGDAVIYALLHDYANKNNLDINLMIDYFKKNPTRRQNFINFVRTNKLHGGGWEAALKKFNTPAFAR